MFGSMTERNPRNGSGRTVSAANGQTTITSPEIGDSPRSVALKKPAAKVKKNLAILEEGMDWVEDLIDILQSEIDNPVINIDANDIEWRIDEIVRNLSSLRIPVNNIRDLMKANGFKKDQPYLPLFEIPLPIRLDIPSQVKLRSQMDRGKKAVAKLATIAEQHTDLKQIDPRGELFKNGFRVKGIEIARR